MNAKQVVGKLLVTENSTGALLLRLTLGVVIFPHGAQKLLGWFGGYGFSGTMGFFTEQMGIPFALGLLVIVAEFFGALALIAGVATRLAALGIGTTIAVAAMMAHLPNGFFMNWTGAQEGEGFEYHILVVGMAAALAFLGGGRFSADRVLSVKLKGEDS